jgi:hypothetical protein
MRLEELALLNPLLPCAGTELLAEGLKVDLGCAVGCVKYVTPNLTKKELNYCEGLAAGGCPVSRPGDGPVRLGEGLRPGAPSQFI